MLKHRFGLIVLAHVSGKTKQERPAKLCGFLCGVVSECPDSNRGPSGPKPLNRPFVQSLFTFLATIRSRLISVSRAEAVRFLCGWP